MSLSLKDANQIISDEKYLAMKASNGNSDKFIRFKNFKGFHSIQNVKVLYEFEKVLGAGQFGKVYQARNIKMDQMCAIKMIQKTKVNQ